MDKLELTTKLILNKRIKNKKLNDVSIIVNRCKVVNVTNAYGPEEIDKILELEVIWMNDLHEFEIGPDTLYIKPETLNEWYIYEPIEQTSEQRNGI